jgi:hypothetical protein
VLLLLWLPLLPLRLATPLLVLVLVLLLPG